MDGNEARMKKVISEKEYLASKGAYADWGDSACHKLPRIRENKRKEILNHLKSKDDKILFLREKLREEYRDKVSKGTIRPPTRIEKLIKIANGHSDNESVQAARRCLKKYKVKWET